MQEKLKRYLFDKYLDMKLRPVRQENESYDFSDSLKYVKNILLLITDDLHNSAALNRYRLALKKIFSNVHIESLSWNEIGENEKNWFGFPEASFFEGFRRQRFDMLIDFTEDDKLAACFSLKTEIPLRVNLNPGKFEEYYNLHIRPESDKSRDNRFDKLLQYLYSFKSLKN